MHKVERHVHNPNYFLYIVLNYSLICVAIFPYGLSAPLKATQLSNTRFMSALKSTSES